MTNHNPTADDRLLVHALVDGELDPAHTLEVERKIAADPELSAERERLYVRRVLREKLPARPLPASMSARRTATWAALAASVAIALLAGSASTYVALAPSGGDRIAEEVADDRRALMASQPYEVASSDRHTVKPWFNGKIPQAPRVVDLAQQDFPLVGGRIDVIGGEAVPALIYRHRQHLISVAAVPDGKRAESQLQRRAVRGYNPGRLARRQHRVLGGVRSWRGELDAFVQAFRSAPAE